MSITESWYNSNEIFDTYQSFMFSWVWSNSIRLDSWFTDAVGRIGFLLLYHITRHEKESNSFTIPSSYWWLYWSIFNHIFLVSFCVKSIEILFENYVRYENILFVIIPRKWPRLIDLGFVICKQEAQDIILAWEITECKFHSHSLIGSKRQYSRFRYEGFFFHKNLKVK